MNSVKIIFFDIDGTLVIPATHEIPQSAYDALNRLREKGILLGIATGRAPACLPDFGGFKFDAYSTFNGSLCYTEDAVIHSAPFSPETVRQLMVNAEVLGRPIAVATKDRVAANGLDDDLRDYYLLAGQTLKIADDFDDVLKNDIYQMMLGCRESDFDDILRNADGAKIAVSWDRAVDVIPAGSGKGSSIGKIIEHFGFDVSEAMAFGDSFNDIEMIEAVGFGVVMGNAPDELKRIADDIAPRVDEDGIFRYCEAKGLI